MQCRRDTLRHQSVISNELHPLMATFRVMSGAFVLDVGHSELTYFTILVFFFCITFVVCIY